MIKSHVMDTPGGEFTLTQQNITAQSFALAVFDVTDKTSFAAVEDFIENFNH